MARALTFWSRANKADVARPADLSKVCVLRKKSVTGMDGLHIANFGSTDHAVDAQIAVGCPRRTDADCLIGKFEVGGIAIGLAENGHRFNAEFTASANHSQCDLTAIGYQDPFEHRLPLRATANGCCINDKPPVTPLDRF